jgi:hypothetical protein
MFGGSTRTVEREDVADHSRGRRVLGEPCPVGDVVPMIRVSYLWYHGSVFLITLISCTAWPHGR